MLLLTALPQAPTSLLLASSSPLISAHLRAAGDALSQAANCLPQFYSSKQGMTNENPAVFGGGKVVSLRRAELRPWVRTFSSIYESRRLKNICLQVVQSIVLGSICWTVFAGRAGFPVWRRQQHQQHQHH